MTIMNWLADWVKWRRKVKYPALCHDAQTSLHSNCTWSARAAKHCPLPLVNQRAITFFFLCVLPSSKIFQICWRNSFGAECSKIKNISVDEVAETQELLRMFGPQELFHGWVFIGENLLCFFIGIAQMKHKSMGGKFTHRYWKFETGHSNRSIRGLDFRSFAVHQVLYSQNHCLSLFWSRCLIPGSYRCWDAL